MSMEKMSLCEESGLDYDEAMSDDHYLTEEDVMFQIWFNENEETILIELAESGADREMDFDLEAEFDKRYQAYLDSQS